MGATRTHNATVRGDVRDLLDYFEDDDDWWDDDDFEDDVDDFFDDVLDWD